MAEKSNLSLSDDFYMIYKGNNVTQALSDIKNKNDFQFSTIVMLCTS